MALFHLSVTQTKRSAGQSAIASAAYRAGERLYSEYYGEYSDYTRKGGVICSDIFLPSHAPPEYADRQTLWNAVEKAERGKNAQLAYSFDIALQNEFSLEENIALARQFLLENFVSRGMVVDFAVHQPDREDGGIPNPHFHVLCPIRPIEQNGKWGLKQRRVYELDEDGNRIRDADGKFVFNAVPTTDWGSPETLEYWRQTWAELCNAKFAEKGIDVRIDHRSYERQGVELLPTVHEGATVRAMEKKGIRTEKGEFNRWIKATNAVIRDIKKKITLLFDWIAEAKAELAKPQAPDLVSLLNAYYTSRRAGAYSQKGKVSNLKEMNETFNYLRANGIYSLEDLERRVSEHSAATESLKKTLDEQTARMKAIKRLYDSSAAFQSLKPVYDGLQKIKFEKPRAKYKAEHETELKQFYAARRKLTGEFPDGKVDMKKLTEEYDELEQAHNTTYGPEPVYPHSAAYAREHGELEQYRASNNVNRQCKESIEAAVREHFDGMYLSHDAAKGVIETYGMERVALVLANTVQLQDWDGRYSRRNKEWAKTIPNDNPETVRCGYVLNSHPAVLDGFIDLVREEQQRSRTQGEKLQPSRPSVRDKLKQELPAHKPAAPKKREPER